MVARLLFAFLCGYVCQQASSLDVASGIRYHHRQGTATKTSPSSLSYRTVDEERLVAVDVKEQVSTSVAPPSLLPKKPKTKEDLFAKWMASDFLEEVRFPGKRLHVEGTIPNYVHGQYLRNGPGAFSTPDGSKRFTHVFDGLAKPQKFDISGGKVTFLSRFLQGQVYDSVMNHHEIPAGVYIGPTAAAAAAASPQRQLNGSNNVFQRLAGLLSFDNACVNVEHLPSSSSSESSGSFVATTDAAFQVEFDMNTLETVGVHRPASIQGIPKFGSLSTITTAHGKTARKDGCFYNFYTEQNFLNGGKIRCHMVRKNKDASLTSIGYVDMPDHKVPCVHEISVTDNFAIMVVCPMYTDFNKLLLKQDNDVSIMKSMEFDASQNAQIHVFDMNRKNILDNKDVGPIASFETDPFLCYHHVNAYDDGHGRIVLDVVAYEDGSIASGDHGYLYMSNMQSTAGRMKQEREGAIWRFEMDIADTHNNINNEKALSYIKPLKKVVQDDVTGLPRCLELVTVDPERLGRPYRYAYGHTGFARGMAGYVDWALIKQDVSKDRKHGIWYEEFSYPSEPVFVANPDGQHEDDGVLLSSVYDSQRGENFLLVLDARTMTEVARAYMGLGL